MSRRGMIAATVAVPIAGLTIGGWMVHSAYRHARLDSDLIAAIRRQDPSAVHRLLAQGASPNARTSGARLLTLGDFLEYLWKAGRSGHSNGLPALCGALRNSTWHTAEDAEMAEALLQKGADPNVVCADGDPVVFHSLTSEFIPDPNSHWNSVEFDRSMEQAVSGTSQSSRNRVSVSSSGNAARITIQLAMAKGFRSYTYTGTLTQDRTLFEAFLRARVNCSSYSSLYGMALTPIVMRSFFDVSNSSTMEQFLSLGGKSAASAVDSSGRSALMQAVFPTPEETRLALLKLLLDHGADVNYRFPAAVDPRKVGIGAQMLSVLDVTPEPGATALMFALTVSSQREPEVVAPIVKLLLDHGADPNLGTLRGDTPLKSARRAGPGWREIVRMLETAGAKQ